MIYLHLNGKYKILFIWFMESEECTFPFGALTNEWALWSRELLIWEEDTLDLALNQETHFPRLKKKNPRGLGMQGCLPCRKVRANPRHFIKWQAWQSLTHAYCSHSRAVNGLRENRREEDLTTYSLTLKPERGLFFKVEVGFNLFYAPKA